MTQVSERRAFSEPDRTVRLPSNGVQVVMSWGGTPQSIVAVKPGGRVVIGEGRTTFLLPAELVPEAFTLLASTEDGAFVLRVPEGATLRAERDGEIVDAGDAGGVRTIAIDGAMRAEVELGAFAFFVQEIDGAEEKTPLARPDLAGWRWALASLAVHGVFLSSLLFMPPSAGALSLDLTQSQRDYVRVGLDAIERERMEMPAPVAAEEPAGAAEGATAEGEAGTAGAPEETRSTGGGARARGESPDPRVPLTRESVTTAGALGTIAAFARSFAVSSPYGAEEALGFAQDDAYGALMADAGFSSGFGGLAMNGAGRGGGCLPGQPCGAGTIGQGELGFGAGARGSTCSGEEFQRIEHERGHAVAVASCSGTLGGGGGVATAPLGGRPPHGPPVLRCAPGPDGQCASVAAGGLSREDVRRVVTRNRAQVRHCYERALQQRPDLEGRLGVSWMIHPEGRVMSARVSGANELHNAEVEQCVTQAVQRWQFPSASSPTAVSYPFVFQTQG